MEARKHVQLNQLASLLCEAFQLPSERRDTIHEIMQDTSDDTAAAEKLTTLARKVKPPTVRSDGTSTGRRGSRTVERESELEYDGEMEGYEEGYEEEEEFQEEEDGVKVESREGRQQTVDERPSSVPKLPPL
eukprot:PhF_6_TR3919/c0_g1_i1/m.5496